jgi:phosphoserine phosphatase
MELLFNMDYVAVIVAKEKNLHPGAVTDLHAILPNAQEAKWLDEHQACEIPFVPKYGLDRDKICALVHLLSDTLAMPLDIAILPSQDRRKKLLLSDMDSTIIEQECLDELASETGQREIVSAITERTMRGEIDFSCALRERVALLKGLKLSRVKNVIDTKITFTPGAKTLLATMKAHGAITALVSSGFTLFTQYVADRLGFDFHFANQLEFEGDSLTGKLIEPMLTGVQKQQTLLRLCQQQGLQPQQALAIGDGANDIPMIESAGLGIAYRGKPIVMKAALAKIAYSDLTSALYFQGFRKSEFIMQ